MKHSFAAALMLAAVLTVISLAPAGRTPAWSAEILTHVTTAKQAILGENVSGARQAAVEKALAQAVQNAFASLVSRETFASNLEFLYDRLMPAARDYVVTYRVLDGLAHNGQYLVGVDSKIDMDLLEKRLKDARIIQSDTDKPVVLLLLSEQTPEDPSAKTWWTSGSEPYASHAEIAIKTAMAQDRIPFARAGTAYPDPAAYEVEFTRADDADAAMDFAGHLKADLVILGRAVAAESANRMGEERTFEGLISLTAYDVNTRTQVFETTTKATAVSQMESQGIAQAMDNASAAAGQTLVEKIDTFWSQAMRREKQFDLVVEGDNFLTRFLTLKRSIREMRDMENMQPKEIGSSHAVLDILFKGSSRQFADAMLLKTFDDFGIEIVEVTDEQVNIRFTEINPEPLEQASEQTDEPAPATQDMQQDIQTEKIEN